MTKKLAALIGIGITIIVLVIFFKTGPGLALLGQASGGGTWLLPLVAVAALLDSINPCAFSVLFLTIAFLFSIGKVRKKILAIGGVYILGIFLVYIFIGLGILQALQLFSTPNFMGKLGATLMIVLGSINVLGDIFPSFPIKLKIPSASHSRIAQLMEKASLPTAFLMGSFVGLVEFPCTGGPYLMVLGLLHDQATFWKGAGYLLLYNFIFVSPLIVILLTASDTALLAKVQAWKTKALGKSRLIGSIFFIILGIIIFIL